MSQCPCGRQRDFESCCAPLISRKTFPKTAEQLMRSRYSAYVKCDVDYIFFSSGPSVRKEFDEKSTRKWAESAEWNGLEILETEAGGEDDDAGRVEFIAHYTVNDSPCNHREIAEFEKVDGIWKFKDGDPIGPEPIRRSAPKIGRNAPCPCGSGKKYKKCCAKQKQTSEKSV